MKNHETIVPCSQKPFCLVFFFFILDFVKLFDVRLY